MDVTLILKIAGVGILVSLASSILNKTGRDEQASFVTVGGIIVVMLMLVGEMRDLISAVRSVFGL
ncbi:MAG: stage III sporulation protein AC [Clostridia bacterium]|nr:stage III sporulation protein AC [Clostridia bacterium]MBO7249943.1 stage III sporulation protein AC [Clostridia bacterium]